LIFVHGWNGKRSEIWPRPGSSAATALRTENSGKEEAAELRLVAKISAQVYFLAADACLLTKGFDTYEETIQQDIILGTPEWFSQLIVVAFVNKKSAGVEQVTIAKGHSFVLFLSCRWHTPIIINSGSDSKKDKVPLSVLLHIHLPSSDGQISVEVQRRHPGSTCLRCTGMIET